MNKIENKFFTTQPGPNSASRFWIKEEGKKYFVFDRKTEMRDLCGSFKSFQEAATYCRTVYFIDSLN